MYLLCMNCALSVHVQWHVYVTLYTSMLSRNLYSIPQHADAMSSVCSFINNGWEYVKVPFAWLGRLSDLARMSWAMGPLIIACGAHVYTYFEWVQSVYCQLRMFIVYGPLMHAFALIGLSGEWEGMDEYESVWWPRLTGHPSLARFNETREDYLHLLGNIDSQWFSNIPVILILVISVCILVRMVVYRTLTYTNSFITYRLSISHAFVAWIIHSCIGVSMITCIGSWQCLRNFEYLLVLRYIAGLTDIIMLFVYIGQCKKKVLVADITWTVAHFVFTVLFMSQRSGMILSDLLIVSVIQILWHFKYLFKGHCGQLNILSHASGWLILQGFVSYLFYTINHRAKDTTKGKDCIVYDIMLVMYALLFIHNMATCRMQRVYGSPEDVTLVVKKVQ